MEFSEVLLRRRMVRNYSDEPVGREVIERIAARTVKAAPSAGFSQERLLVVADAGTRERIADTFAYEDEDPAIG